jgi:CRP-like cAMP-binding protein
MSKTILEHILDGAIVIDSGEAFASVVKEFPEHPELLKLFADFLTATGKGPSAAQHYSKASEIFLGSGRLLHAVVAKMLEWRFDRPCREALLRFLSAVSVHPHDESPVNRFLQSLLPAELMALFSQFSCHRFPSGKTIRTIGEPETHLWFVLAGELKESYYQLIGHKPKFNKQRLQQGASRLLGKNNVFGDVFPFTEISLSQIVIETTACTEVIAIPRRRLIQVCQKFPKVELGILKLLQIRSEKGSDSPSGKVRRGERYAMQVNMTVEIHPKGGPGPAAVLNGSASDLSLSGVSFIPEANGAVPPAKLASLVKDLDHQRVRVAISSEALTMSIPGQIVRTRELVVNGSRTLALGIQFDEVSPRARGAFLAFAEGTGNFDKTRNETRQD